jgi:hypothetical protein
LSYDSNVSGRVVKASKTNINFFETLKNLGNEIKKIEENYRD